MSRFHIFTPTPRSLGRHLAKRKNNAKSAFKRTIRPFEEQPSAETNTRRFFHTRISTKRNRCKLHPTREQFRLSTHQYLALKRRIQWNKTRPVPSHRRSMHRVVTNDSETTGFQILSIDRKNGVTSEKNFLYKASRTLPEDLVGYMFRFLEHETFWSMPAVNRRIHYLFSPAKWCLLMTQRIEEVVRNDLDALWGYSCRRSRIQPCSFGRQLSMQTCRAVVRLDGSFQFCGNERSGRRLDYNPSPTVETTNSKVSIIFDRVFDFQLYFGLPREPESAFRISSIGRAHVATGWQKMILKRFVQALVEANDGRAPNLMRSSDLGANSFVLPPCLQ